MGIAERREREKERVRTLIVEAARDIVSEQGLDALSMRAIAERIEYSPATIYLYFRDKSELIGSVVVEGVRRMAMTMAEELAAVGADADPRSQYAATGRAYVRFALENTAYFRVMFELPAVAQLECPAQDPGEVSSVDGRSWDMVVGIVQRGIDAGHFQTADANRGAVIGWGLVHGLTSLYLGGHLREHVESPESFMELVEEAMRAMQEGWQPAEVAGTAPAGGEAGAETRS